VSTSCLVGLALDDFRYALPLASVERVVRAVEITPLPHGPDVILGIINVRGQVVPVADIRKRFGLPPRDVAPSDHIVIARTSRRPLALVADVVHGVIECDTDEVIVPAGLVPGLEYVRGIARTQDGFVLIHDLDKFLALDEERSLHRALEYA
jgi:purine-binding chemotaxis protein CheW